MRDRRVGVLTEVALSVALAAVLAWIKLVLPVNFAGGSVSLAMLPIVVVAFRRGAGAGVAAGAVFGAVDYLIEPFFVHPVQVMLDYGVAFAAVGLTGLGAGAWGRAVERGDRSRQVAVIVTWVTVGVVGRFAASVLSGVVFFASNAPEGQPVLLYSLLYNASYLLPSLLATVVSAVIVLPALERAVPVHVPETI